MIINVEFQIDISNLFYLSVSFERIFYDCHFYVTLESLLYNISYVFIDSLY